LFIDFANPSPALGWENLERKPFFERIKIDLIMALAVVHHLTIVNQIPFHRIAGCFAKIAPHLLIEFPDVHDSQVELLLRTRRYQGEYSREKFEEGFLPYYTFEEPIKVACSKRYLYLMRRRTPLLQ